MEKLLKKEHFNFEVLDSVVVQVILLPNQVLYTELSSIIYASSTLSFKQCPRSLWEKLFGLQHGLNYRIKNHKGGVEYVSISHSPGKILAVNPNLIDELIIPDKRFILGYSSGIKIRATSNPIPFPMINNPRQARGNGILFLQSFGTIIEKRLGVDEEIHINTSDIIAYSKSVKVFDSSLIRNSGKVYLNDWALMKLQGPGWVFIEGCNKKKMISTTKRSGMNLAFLLLSVFMITLLVLSKFV